jgi:hypothetical protein
MITPSVRWHENPTQVPGMRRQSAVQMGSEGSPEATFWRDFSESEPPYGAPGT